MTHQPVPISHCIHAQHSPTCSRAPSGIRVQSLSTCQRPSPQAGASHGGNNKQTATDGSLACLLSHTPVSKQIAPCSALPAGGLQSAPPPIAPVSVESWACAQVSTHVPSRTAATAVCMYMETLVVAFLVVPTSQPRGQASQPHAGPAAATAPRPAGRRLRAAHPKQLSPAGPRQSPRVRSVL